jgi:competence protein ComGC
MESFQLLSQGRDLICFWIFHLEEVVKKTNSGFALMEILIISFVICTIAALVIPRILDAYKRNLSQNTHIINK